MTKFFSFCLFCTLVCTGCVKTEQQQNIVNRVALIDSTRLKSHVETLTGFGPRSVENLHAVKNAVSHIKASLIESGLQPVEEEVGISLQTADNNYSFVNVIADITGSENPDQVIEVGAHYDTVDKSPGADDNASGVAAILEIARILSTSRTRKTVRLCFYALEETGMGGSSHHVMQYDDKNESLEGTIILEMVGYSTDRSNTQASPARIPLLFWPPETGNFIAVVGNFRSGGLGNRFESASRKYAPQLPYYSANRLGGFFKDAMRSDHKPYWDRDYKAIMLTDTANFRNPHYHLESDRTGTLDFTFLKYIAQATASTLLEWSGLLPE